VEKTKGLFASIANKLPAAARPKLKVQTLDGSRWRDKFPSQNNSNKDVFPCASEAQIYCRTLTL
jgi:hypothetical protein